MLVAENNIWFKRRQFYIVSIISILLVFMINIYNQRLGLAFIAFGLIFLLVISHWSICFCLYILINESFYGLINTNYISLPGGFTLRDISFLLLVILFSKFWNIKIEKFQFRLYFIFLMFWSVIEAFNANFIYNQPLIAGLKANRWVWLYLIYFCVLKLLNNKKDKDLIYKILIFFGLLTSIISIIAYLNGGKVWIIQYRTGERFGDLQLSLSPMLVITSIYLLLDKIFNENEHIKSYLIILIINCLNIFFIVKTRACVIGIIFMIFMVIMMQRKVNKVFVMVLLSLLVVYGAFNTNNPLTRSINSAMEDYNSNGGTVGIRVKGINYFVNETLKSPIIGRGGSLSLTDKNSLAVLRMEDGFYLSDIGVTGWFFKYGIVGVVWYIFVLLKVLRLSFIRHNGKIKFVNCSALGYFLFTTITISTLVHFDSPPMIIYNSVIFAIFEHNHQINKESLLASYSGIKKLEK